MLPLETGTPIWGHGIQGAFPGLSDALCYSSLTSNCNSSGCGPNHSGRAEKAAGDPEPNLANTDGAREQETGWGLGLFYGQRQPLQWKHIKWQVKATLLSWAPDPTALPTGPSPFPSEHLTSTQPTLPPGAFTAPVRGNGVSSWLPGQNPGAPGIL